MANAGNIGTDTLLRRRTTRRALLAGAVTAAAGGAAGMAGYAATQTLGSEGTGGNSVVVPGVATDGATPGPEPLELISDPLTRAAHLLRRAGWGGTPAQIGEFAALTREQAAERLLDYTAAGNTALDARIASAGFNLTTPGPGLDKKRPPLVRDIQRWWLMRMCYTARPLEERMAYIWHGLLVSGVSQVGGGLAKLLVTQNELYRSLALAKYDDLLQAASKDPAMMIYLNTVDSTKEHPNENYARELMELFSMGEGNYTEDDVRESARAFTGWRFSRPTERPPEGMSPEEVQEWRDQQIAAWQPSFYLQAKLHDSGTKTFLGKTGSFGGEDIVAIIMEQPAAGRFIVRRLFRELAYRDPDEAVIERLIGVWNSSGHSVREVVRAILVSDEFYSTRAYRGLVRSPVEFIVGAVRGLEIETNFPNLAAATPMDQQLFNPPNVAGWPGGASWLSSGTFFARLNFLDTSLFPKGKPVAIPTLTSQGTAESVVDEALRRLVDGSIPAASRAALIGFAQQLTNPDERAASVAYLVLASPEYQLN